MNADASIVLAGFMGTGKSTVGRILARRMNRVFLDLDAFIEEREDRSIPEIFASGGEQAFRRVEREAVRAVSSRRSQVVAVGGGAVLDSDNVSDFSDAGLLVCLDARPDVILARVEQERHRPLLETGDRMRLIMDLLAQRAACYGALPVHVDTSDLSPEQVADRVLELFSHVALRDDGVSSMP